MKNIINYKNVKFSLNTQTTYPWYKCCYYLDLVTGLVTVLTDIIWKTTEEWHAGTVGCKIIKYLQVCENCKYSNH